jgi:hypothetical protein
VAARRLVLACLLAGLYAGGCRQTVVLDDLGPDASLSGSGGKGKGGSSGTGGGGGPADASADGRCFGGQTQPLSYQWDVPQMVIALDRSQSMNTTTFGNSGTSTELEAALNAIYSLVSAYGGDHNTRQAIKFAFIDFPDGMSSSCSASSASSGCCPSDPTTNFTDFDNTNLACSGPGPSTCLQSTNRPTAAALNEAVDYFNSSSGSAQHSERYVVLVSDGDPVKGPCQGGDACNDAENAKSNLAGVSATLEVVAIGGSTGSPCLSNLGATNQVPSPYYFIAPDSDPNSLPYAFQQIGSTVAQNACRLSLATTPTSGHLTVVFDGVVQTQDSGTTGNGWNWDNNTRVFLHGNLCQSFLQSSPGSSFGLQIYDGCISSHGSTP